MGYDRHPVGMTMKYPVPDQSKVNDVLFDSPADWISPGFDDVESPMQNSRWLIEPPANDGAKVIISDTDHYSPMKSDALWAWKSFLRGHNPTWKAGERATVGADLSPGERALLSELLDRIANPTQRTPT